MELYELDKLMGVKRTNAHSDGNLTNSDATNNLLYYHYDLAEDALIGAANLSLNKIVKAYADKEVLMGAASGRASKLALDSK